MGEKTRHHHKDVGIYDEESRRGIWHMALRGLAAGSMVSVLMLLAACGIEAIAGRWNQGLSWCASAIAAGLAGGILQQLWFGYSVLTKPSYPVRVAGFGLSYYLVLAACSFLGGWFPTENAGAWASFTFLYLVLLTAITAGFTIAFRVQGASYTQRLEAYRKRNSRE